MTTNLKDFKVKNGLVVTNGGSFGNAVAVGEPTLGNHATTKDYVDNLTGTPVGNTAPLSPDNGDMWFDTTVERLKVYYETDWYTIATSIDVQNIPDHIHDTAIDGDGRIVTVFWDAAQYDDPQISTLNGGTPFSNTWAAVFDGGNPDSEFN
ncbi:hypothetical protein UFOVP828_41 [uncultured Caudovirales phage]|uniref:Uncharacterized protein n=1 Tax=uncultured Caudovirales phage TaxID=2100421 RepID=A0A6J5NZQ9_9CAUD|nr:hypothetical protein UFOVP828_41 [uncultured Caudovirales phage]